MAGPAALPALVWPRRWFGDGGRRRV